MAAFCFTGLIFWVVIQYRADNLEPSAVSLVGYADAEGARALIVVRNPFRYSIDCVAKTSPVKGPHPGTPRLASSRAAGKWSNQFGVGNNCQPGPHENGVMSVPIFPGQGTDVIVTYRRDLHPLSQGYNQIMAWLNRRQNFTHFRLVDPPVHTVTTSIAAR